MSKRELKDLVPPLELCKQIPEGTFADSALVWDSDYDNWYVVERETADPDIAIPAPTFEEILPEIARFVRTAKVVFGVNGFVGLGIQAWCEPLLRPDSSATVALKLLLKMKQAERTLKMNALKINADKIRSMSNEELAELLYEASDTVGCPGRPGHWKEWKCPIEGTNKPCDGFRCWLDWLNAEAKEEE